jgi:hypothetical protein
MLTRQEVARMSKIATEAVRAALAGEGLQVDGAGARFDDASATLKIRVALPPSSDARRAAFVEQARLWRVDPGAFGKTFVARGDTYTIEGLNFRARRFPVEARNARDGRVYRFTTRVLDRVA